MSSDDAADQGLPRRALWTLLALSLLGCAAPAALQKPRHAQVEVLAPPVAHRSGPAGESPKPEWLLDLYHGRRTFEGLIDPQRGVFVGEAHSDFGNDDPAPDEDGWVRRAELICAAGPTVGLSKYLSQLQLLESGEADQDMLGCSAMSCWITGQGEYAMTYMFNFRTRANGTVLDSVIGVERSIAAHVQMDLKRSLLRMRPQFGCSRAQLH